jgi:tetratricopeptide (TPR) repeat protein
VKRFAAPAVLIFTLSFLFVGRARALPQNSTLDEAKSQAAAGNFLRASQLFQQVLNGDPNNIVALQGLTDALVAQGHWKDAIDPLQHLDELQPNDADRLFQLGQMESWQPGQRDHALTLLARSTEIDPSNVEHQEYYADVLSWDASGRSQALDILHGILSSHPDDAAARRLMARILAEQHQPQQAAATLSPLLNSPGASAEDFWAQGQVDQSEGNNSAAIADYRQALQRDPRHLKSIEDLAPMLSWNSATRPEAASLFERGLRESPDDLNLLIPYAEMLSWDRVTRPDALRCYKKVLAQDPHNVQALTGEAQLLSWSGHSSQAMDIYAQILSRDPNNVAALRGEAQILGWRGNYRQALKLAQQAHAADPSDSAATLELAQAEYDLGHYAEASDDLTQVKNIDTPDYTDLKANVDHALGTYFELGYDLRRDGMILDYDSLDAIVSTPLGSQNRLSAMYQPFRYRTNGGDFTSNYYALMLDSQPSDSVATHAQFATRTYPGVPTQYEGAFDAAFAVRPSFKLNVSFDRQSDQETLVSTLGADEDGVFVGQVETNLGSIGASYSNSQHHYDASLTYTDGVYTGENLASNRRWSFDGNIGKSIRGNRPYIRIGYGFTYLSFDHDAEFQPGSGAPPRVTGGYYSPTEYLLNYGQLFVSGNFGRHTRWDFGGFAGVQNAQTFFNSFSTPEFASTFSTHFTWSMTTNNELRLGYDYLNVFNAFHRNLFFVAWRHYF